MAAVDYYQVLGVPRNATADEIRKAYRRLARENHPDVKKDDPQAAERFKQIQEAYAVLGDPQKRQQYDQFGHSPFFGTEGPQAGWTSAPGGGRTWTYTWTGGPGQTPIDIEEWPDLFEIFTSQTGRRSRRPPPGNNLKISYEIPFELAVTGGKADVSVNVDGREKKFVVKIPQGVEDGAVIRLAGEGAPSLHGGPAGDLLITLRIKPHRFFRREGDDLYLEVPLTPSEAVLGTKVEIPTLTEGMVVLTIPPGTSSGTKLRLRGKGIHNPQKGHTGDLYAITKIEVPKNPSATVKQLYQQLAPLEPSPRTGLWS
ncbi:MAG: curved DNA-binding protein [Planctomycetaceae bacterium]|nr:MAG: curved DNA-binding protein [Planctomycetaceae bacterium]